MRVQVKPIRQNGARLSDQRIASLPATEGYLSLYGLGTTLQLSLTNGEALQESLIPDLYDARLVTMQDAKMLFVGIQRTEDPRGAQYFQEWSVFISLIKQGDG